MAECVFQRRSEYIVKQQEERKRRAKNIKIVVGICLVVLFLGNVSLYAITEKTLLTLFFGEADEEQLDFMWERMVEDGESIEYDGYTFTLERHLYDRNTGTGCFEVSVTKEGMDMRNFKVNKDRGHILGIAVGVEKDDDLYLSIGLKHGRICDDVHFSSEKDKFTLYASFEALGLKRSNELCLYDMKNGEKINDYEVERFFLENNDYSIQVEGDIFKRASVSYNIIQFLKTTERITDVSLGMKNGTEIAYWKDGLCTKATNSVTSESGGMTQEEIEQFADDMDKLFEISDSKPGMTISIYPKKHIDIFEVAYIKVNGEIYEFE